MLAGGVLGSLIGTYLDLYFVGKGMYEFTFRPLADVFSINIGFTLVMLPIFMAVFLYVIAGLNKWGKMGVILFVSFLMPILEKLAEVLGLFKHAVEWKHIYTFLGYLLFLSAVTMYFQWLQKEEK